MSVKIEIYFDTRSLRKTTNDYPYKLRVYHEGVAKLYPTILALSENDHKKLEAPNLGPKLREVRDNLKDIEEKAAQFIKKMEPFCFDDFQRDFVKDNPLFEQARIKARPLAFSEQEFDYTPFCSKFPILLETPAPETIGEIYLLRIREKLATGKSGPIKTAILYQCAYHSIKRFSGNVPFKKITPEYLRKYADWMKNHTDEVKKKKCTKSTIGMYTVTMRTMFNEAIRRKIIKEDYYPFGERQFAIPGSNNIKKAYEPDIIEQIYYYDAKKPPMRKARSFWFFMYFGQGMNPKDVCLRQFKDINGEFLEFERAKTEETMKEAPPKISAYINEDMWQTINEYGNKDRDPENYIFPIFQPDMTPLRQCAVLEYFIKFVNKWMQAILDDLGIDKEAGCQPARHSYSTIRAMAGASLLEIGQDLGHKKFETTKRYVASLPLAQKKVNICQVEAFKRRKKETNADLPIEQR